MERTRKRSGPKPAKVWRGRRQPYQSLNNALTGRSYKGQQVIRVTIPGTPQNLVNAVTTGLLAFNGSFDPTTDITDWTTRFVNTFEEYRLRRVTVKLVASGTSGTPGIAKVWIDEKYTSTPGLGESLQKTTNTVAMTTTKRQRDTWVWRCADLLDLQWNAGTQSPSGTAHFKVFTDNTHYNAPIVATSLFIYQAFYDLEFRGIEEQ